MPNLRPTPPPIQWALRSLSSWVIGHGRDAGHLSPPSTSQVNVPSLPHMPLIPCTEAQALYTYTFWIRCRRIQQHLLATYRKPNDAVRIISYCRSTYAKDKKDMLWARD